MTDRLSKILSIFYIINIITPISQVRIKDNIYLFSPFLCYITKKEQDEAGEFVP